MTTQEQLFEQAKQYSRWEAVQVVHKERGSFISETCHFVSEKEDLPFYVNEKRMPHLSFRPLTRNERRNINKFKAKVAHHHALKLSEMLEKFQAIDIYEEVNHVDF